MNSLSGLALHSGVPSTLSAVRRAEDHQGLRFFWPGFDQPLSGADLAGLRRTARRATVLEGTSNAARGAEGDKAVIRTPEHLLAAALFFADAPLDILCTAAEPPGLDGSALPFYRMLADVSAAWRAREYKSDLEWEYEGPEGSLRARPHTHFSVDYTWEDGDVSQHFELARAEDVPIEVLPARTFILYRDYEKLTANVTGNHTEKLLGGAGAESGLLLATTPDEFARAKAKLPDSRGKTYPLIHPEFARFENEAARHKVLDLLGDLALNGLALPRLHLTIRNGGHALNHLLLDRLQGESHSIS